MLYIMVKDLKTGEMKTVTTWHIGSPFPKLPPSRVVSFQADGDELEFMRRKLSVPDISAEELENLFLNPHPPF